MQLGSVGKTQTREEEGLKKAKTVGIGRKAIPKAIFKTVRTMKH